MRIKELTGEDFILEFNMLNLRLLPAVTIPSLLSTLKSNISKL